MACLGDPQVGVLGSVSFLDRLPLVFGQYGWNTASNSLISACDINYNGKYKLIR